MTPKPRTSILALAAMLFTVAMTGCQQAPTPPSQRAASPVAPAAQAPLSSWNDGAARTAVVSFVERVTREGGPDFVPPAERIAVFDNDGTLWSEQAENKVTQTATKR